MIYTGKAAYNSKMHRNVEFQCTVKCMNESAFVVLKNRQMNFQYYFAYNDYSNTDSILLKYQSQTERLTVTTIGFGDGRAEAVFIKIPHHRIIGIAAGHHNACLPPMPPGRVRLTITPSTGEPVFQRCL